MRSHELNSFLAYIRGADSELEHKIESILAERNQSFVVTDVRVSQLREDVGKLVSSGKIAEKLADHEFVQTLKYFEVSEIYHHLTEERNRLKLLATCDEPNEDDVAKYLDVIQVSNKFDKIFVKTDPPMGESHSAKKMENLFQLKAMAEYMFTIKLEDSELSPVGILTCAAEKCCFDLSLYQKCSNSEMYELKVGGVIIKPSASVRDTDIKSRDVFLMCVLESFKSCDFLKIDSHDQTSPKILSLSTQSEGDHVSYANYCSPRFVLRS